MDVKKPRIAFALVAALLTLAACSEQSGTDGNDGGAGGTLPLGSGFDYYVLALSWSPSYCAVEGEDANRQQCDSGRPYGFIVHGLWPQFERGYPANCPTDLSLDVPKEALRKLYDIMPSAGLIRHQWKKHGTCSGLTRADYFATLRKARETVTIPAEFARLDDYTTVDPDVLERAFLASNEGSDAAGIVVTCGKRYLREVRLCMTKSLDFRTCPELERRACSSDKAVMPPARGG
ncbi:MAG: ribonuclease [Rhizobiaceae bacterium]